MSAVLTPTAPAPKWAGGARPVRWTVATFHKAREAGQLEGERTFLLRGVLMEQGPMNPPHASCVSFALESLQRIVPAGLYVRVQLPLVLNLYTDPFPDLAVVEGTARDYTKRHPQTAALVVEVSDSTLDIDTTDKAALYAMAGIPDY